MKHFFQRFIHDDRGVATIHFVMLLPLFLGFFLMAYEAGIYLSRQVMLEHGVDTTVRKVRVGQIDEADTDALRTALRQSICSEATILPDCENQLEVEMIQRDLHSAWVPLDANFRCVDRGNLANPYDGTLDTTANNEMMFLRVCIRVDPFLPTWYVGRRLIEEQKGDTAAQGSYALVTTAAFVVEPFRPEP